MVMDLSSLLVPAAQGDVDGTLTETYQVPSSAPFVFRLGSKLSVPYPAGVPMLPKGASPQTPPIAPTAGAALTSGPLVANGSYKWAVTYVTQYGETTPGTALGPVAIGSGNTGQTLTLPGVTASAGAAPILQRRVYRTKNGGSTFYLAGEIDDAAVTSFVDTLSDSQLLTTAPASNTSGLTGAVSLSGASQSWTEEPNGATLSAVGQFSVDYTATNTGGTITHYSGDAGKTVTVQYTAATLLTALFFRLFSQALATIYNDIPGLVAANQNYVLVGGVPTPPGSGFSIAQPATQAWVDGVYVNVAAQTLSGSSSGDVYCDLDTSGTYHFVSQAHNNGGLLVSPPALTANSIRLFAYYALSGNITTFTAMANTYPIDATALRTGLRQRRLFSNSANSPNLNATSWATLPWSFTNTPQLTTTGGAIYCRLSTSGLNSGGAPVTISFQALINGQTYDLKSVYIGATTGTYGYALPPITTGALPAGTYPVTLQYKLSGAVNVGAPLGGLVLELEEIA